MWSIGVIMFILLCGKPPFYGDTNKEILKSVEKGNPDYREKEWKHVSKEARNLLDQMLTVDPYARISIANCLKHEWFKVFPIKIQPSRDQLNRYYINIISFKADPKYFFQHASLAYMVHHILKKEVSDPIRELFSILDKKGEGKLIYDDIVDGFKNCQNYSEKEILKVIKYIDVMKVGYIEYEEFLRACISKTDFLTDENLKVSFYLFTKDENKKYITPTEFKGYLGLQSKFSDKTWDAIIKEIDKNGDGMIEYDEFKEMMLKLLEE